MGNLAADELPTPPRPLGYLLPKAIQAFIETEWTDRTKMIVPAWAATFHVEADSVREEWDRQMTVKSQSPDNAFEIEGK
jgi:hypothetical protein